MAVMLASSSGTVLPTHHQPKIVVKDAAAMEQRQRESKDLLEALLQLPHCRAALVGQLVVDLLSVESHGHATHVILSEGEHGNE